MLLVTKSGLIEFDYCILYMEKVQSNNLPVILGQYPQLFIFSIPAIKDYLLQFY